MFIQSSCVKGKRVARKATSNPGMKSPVERSMSTVDPQVKSFTNRNVNRFETSEPKTFHRGMNEKDLKIEFFILEDNPNFHELNEKEKMLKLISESSKDLKQWYYELGIEGKLPTRWKEFKDEVAAWCQGNDWTSIRKYQDEPWSSYIERLKDKIGAGDDKKVFMKMEQEDLPRDIKIILLSSNTGSIDELIDRIRKL